MRNAVYLLAIIFAFCIRDARGQSPLSAIHDEEQMAASSEASLFEQLDSAISRIPEYDAAHQKKIDALKEQLKYARGNISAEMHLNDLIIDAYNKFSYDSTRYYLDRNLKLAEVLREQGARGEENRVTEMQLRKARLYAKAGAYLEAVSLVKDIPEESLSDSLRYLYYNACRDVYGEAGHYSIDSTVNIEYGQLAAHYRHLLADYLWSKGAPSPLDTLSLQETSARNEERYDDALRYNAEQMVLVDPESPRFSEIAFFRSWIYRNMNNRKMEKHWLLRSAIGDVRNSIKDQASLWTLANLLSEEGDVEWSYKLIRTSQEGLSTYNTPLRNLQSVSILSMIDHNYQLMTDHQNKQLRWSLILISILALLLAAAVVYVFLQMKRLSTARHELHEANKHLTSLNGQLSETNGLLSEANSLLSDSNRIKEVYIGRFLALCSAYMKKMDSFRSTVLKKEKSGQLADYLSAARMREMKDHELEALMDDFDTAFLNIIPTFIDDFNALLKPEERIIPPKKNTLTTELRIFALIRLGITDSSKIAEFLHYSVHTIYNYRSTVKNAAIGARDTFEDQVRMIGNPL